MNIRIRFLVSFLLVALVPLVVASGLFLVLGRNALRDQALNKLESVATIQKKRVESRMSQSRDRLAQAKSQTHLLDGIAAYAANRDRASLAAITQSLQDEVSALPDFKNMSVLDMSGKVIASTDQSLVGKDESQSIYFQKGKNGDDVSTFARGPDGGLVQYLAGLVKIGGKPLGVLAIETSATDLTQLMTDYSGLGKTGETVLAEKTSEGNARFLGPTRFGEKAALSTIVPGEKANVPINIALQNKSEVLTDSVDYRGKPVLAATEHIDDPPLGLVVKIDRSEAFAPANRLVGLLGIVFGATALLVIVVSLLLSGSITRPIVALTGVAEAVSAGDLTRRADFGRTDEVGSLATAFNKMTDDLVEERDNLERKVEERTAELARSNIELDGYAHTVSHDLRGPVSSINLAGAILAEELEGPSENWDRDELLQLTGHIRTSTDRSFALINDLLTLAEAGQKPAAVDAVDIDETVGRILTERAQRIADKGARVQVEAGLGVVIANATQVYQLFSNLIINAVKHNDSGEPVVEVRRLKIEGVGCHRFEVRDNGPGITDEDFPRIFEPFFKGRGGETGIGLATVRKIVETYGGTIEARNEDAGGACFEFTLYDYEETPGLE